MPNSIDERIVKMEFDNSRFEKNIHTSINSLEQLDKALELKDASKGFEEMEKAANSIDLSKLERAAEVIEKRFSTAGIAGAAVINRVVNGAIDAVTGLGKTVINLAKTGGISRAMKLEHANFMLNGLIKNEEKVTAILNGPVSKAVKGTAYGLDSAANAASQFVASGIEGLEELEQALTAVSGVAAMTGSEYDDIASIFTTVAGQGKVMTRQLRQIEARGLNAAAAIAKFCNTTEEEVRDMVQKGKIDFNTFSQALNEAFGDQAKKANETFTGALSNVKAALSRIGAKIATPAFESLRKVLVSLIRIIDNMNEVLSGSLIKDINSLIIKFEAWAIGLLNNKKTMVMLTGVAENLGKAFKMVASWIDPIRKAFRSVFPRTLLDNLISFNEGLGRIIDKLTFTDEKAFHLQHALTGIFDILDLILRLVGKVFNLSIPGIGKVFAGADSLANRMLKIAGFVGYLVDKFHDFVVEGGLIRSVMTFLNEVFGEGIITFEHLGDVIKAIAKGIAVVAVTIGLVVADVARAIRNIINYLSQLEEVQVIIAGVSVVVQFLGEQIAKVIKMIANAIGFVLTVIHELANGNVASIFDSIKRAVIPLGSVFDSVTESIKSFFGLFSSSSVKKAQDGIEKVTVKFDKNYGGIASQNAAKSGVVVRNSPITTAANSAQKSATILDKALASVSNSWDKFTDSFKKSSTVVKDNVQKTQGSFEGFYNNMKTTVSGFANLGTLFSIGFGAAVIATIVSIARIIVSISRMFSGLGQMSMSINNFFNALTVGVDAFAIMQIAISIGAIAAALFILTKKCDPKALLKTAGTIAVLMAAITGLVAVMKYVDPKAVGRFREVTTGLLAMSASLVVLAAALKKIYEIAGNAKQLYASVGALLVLMAGLTAVGIAMGTFAMRGLNVFKGGLALIEMAAAINLLASALAKLEAIDLEKASRTVPILLKIMAGMSMLVLASSLMFSPVAGIGMVGVVAAILLLIKACEYLNDVDPKALDNVERIVDMLGKWAKSIIIAVGIFAVIYKVLETGQALLTYLTLKIQGASNLFNKLITNVNVAIKRIGNAAAIAAMFVGVAGAVWIMAEAIVKLGKLTPDELKQGSNVVAVLTGVVLAIGVLITKMGIELGKRRKAAESIKDTMIAISAFLISMSVSLKLLSTIGRDELIRAGNAVGAMTIVMGALIAVMSLIRTKAPMITASIASMTALSIFLLAMTAAVGILSLIFKDAEWDQWLKAIGSILAVTAGMAAILVALGRLAAFTVPATVAVGLISVLFLSLAGSFWILGKTNLANAKENLIMLGSCVALLAVVVAALSILTTTTGGIGAGAIAVAEALVEGLVGILGSLAGVGYLLGAIDANGLKATFETLGEGLDIFTDAIKHLGERLLSEEWKAIMAGGYGLLGFAYILQAFVPVAVGFSAAAVLFGAAVYAFGEGVKALGAGLQTMQNIDTTTVSANLKSIAESCSSLGYYGPGLIIAGAGFMSLGVGLAAFDIGAAGAVAILKTLSTKDIFSNIEQNFQILANAFKTVTNNILYFGTTFALLAGFIAMTFVLSGAILALSLAIGVFGGALYILFSGLNAIMGLAERFGQWISDLATNLNEAATAIDNLGRTTVQDIYAALIQNADMLKDAGKVLVEKVAAGFEEGINDYIKPAVERSAEWAVDAFTSTIEKCKGDIKQAGENFAKYFLEGYAKEIEQHSPPKKMTDNANWACTAFTSAIANNKDALASAGINFADWFGGSLTSGLGDYLNKALDMLNGFISQFNATIDGYNREVAKINMGQWVNKNQSGGYYGGKGITRQDEYESRKKGREQIQQAAKDVQAKKISAATLDKETGALDKNSGAAGRNSKAKEENEEANEGKTEAIDEETESLGEESEQTEETSEDIRALAEQIEVVTEKYNELNATLKYQDKFKFAAKQLTYLGQAWSKSFKDIKRSSDGTEKVVNHTYKEISYIFNSIKSTIPKTTDYISRGLYAFADDKYDKKLTKHLKNVSKSVKSIEKQVLKSGDTIAKVGEGYAKVYYKSGNKVDKMTIRLTKNVKNLGKQFKAAKTFVDTFNNNVKGAQYAEDLIENIRNIENFFVKRQNMPQKVQDYLGEILANFKGEFKNAMNILAKNIDGIGDYWKKGTQSTAYVADAFVNLAAALYDGSEAANKYWTEIAQLEFLAEHGEIAWEEVEAARIDYLTRAVEALKEYYTTLQDTIGGQFNPFEEFDEKMEDQTKNLLDCIESQIAGFQNWGDMLMELSKRGANFDLVKQLTDQGVASFGLVKNLLSMTEGELALYNKRYRESAQAIQTATDTAVAALANARTMATARAAAKSGKLTAKQMEKSRNAAKQLSETYLAVAKNQATYNKMSKKEEKEYMAQLSKSERKKYKQAKKEQKRALKEQERLAAEENAKRVEEQRVENIMKTIEGYDTLIQVIDQYCNDTNVMTKINEKLDASFKGVYKNLGKSSTITKAWLQFGKQLGAEGEDAESFFSSLESTISSFRDGIKDALYDLTKAFTQFKDSTETISNEKLFSNAISQARASRLFGAYIERMANMGYNSQIIEYIGKKFASDQAEALNEMKNMVNATRQEITNLNDSFKAYSDAMERSMQQADQAVVRSQQDPALEAFQAAEARYNEAQAKLKTLTNDEESMMRIESKFFKAYVGRSEEIYSLASEMIFGSDTRSRQSARRRVIERFKDDLEQLRKMENVSAKAKVEYAKRLAERYKLDELVNTREAEKLRSTMEKIQQKIDQAERRGYPEVAEHFREQLAELKEEYKNFTVEGLIGEMTELYNAEYEAAMAEAEAATAAYQQASAAWKAEQAIRDQLAQERALQEAFENALIELSLGIEKYEDLISAISKAGWNADYLTRTYRKLKTALDPVNRALTYAKNRFKEFDGTSKSVVSELSMIEEGFFRLASALEATNDESGTLIENLGARLENYRKQLYDTLNGQSQLFDEFKKYSGEEPTSANKYLNNMASQIDALETWLNNLEALSARGVSGDILQMFVSEGLNSYEKVAAFMKATDEQLGDLIYQYRKYKDLMEGTNGQTAAADRALALIANSYTDKAMSLADQLVKAFTDSGMARVKDVAENTAIMVIEGIKDGLTHAMPTIQNAVNESTSVTTMAERIGESVATGINNGLIQAVSTSVEDTVRAAVEKFKMAVDEINQYVQANLQSEYTITVHVNMSEIDQAVARFNSSVHDINIGAGATSQAVQSSMANNAAVVAPTAPTTQTSSPINLNYTQNNYSPKALSRPEIYRQTRNQLSTIEGVVSSATGG